MDNAVNKMKAGEKRKASDLVTLEEESNDVTDDDKQEDKRYEFASSVKFPVEILQQPIMKGQALKSRMTIMMISAPLNSSRQLY